MNRIDLKRACYWLPLSLIMSSPGEAALYDRGQGLIYDDVLNITWLQDANYAKTSGYDSDGLMNWQDANTWAASLSYGGFDDWRLPTLSPSNGTAFDYNFSYDGSTDQGNNITSPTSELAYMYHVNLNNIDNCSTTGICPQPGWTFGTTLTAFQDTANGNAIKNFSNLTGHDAYWYGNEYAPDTSSAWSFWIVYGEQNGEGSAKAAEFNAWAVRDGDVSSVPVPGAVWLFGSAIAGLVGFGRRKTALSA